MERETLIKELKQKLDLKIYVAQAIEDKTVIPMLLDIIETDRTAMKYLCEIIIREISEESPEFLYHYFERMAMLLKSENSFIKLGFILTLPNMLKVDNENK